MVSIILMIVIGLVMLVIGILVGYILRKSIGEKTIGNAEQKAKNMILDAENRAETVKKELVLEAKEEAHRQRNDLEKEIRERYFALTQKPLIACMKDACNRYLTAIGENCPQKKS